MKRPSGDDPLRTGSFFLLMASVFTVSMGYGVVLPILPFWLERISGSLSVPWHTGMLAGVYMLALFAFAPLWGRVSDRIGRRPVILLGLGGFVLTLVLFGFSQSLWLGYLARILGGVFASALLPVTLAYVADTSDRERRARRFAWMSAATLLGFLAGPALAGWLSGAAMTMPSGTMVRRGAIWLPFLATGVLGAGVLLASWFWLPEPAASPSPQRDEEPLRPNGATLQALFLLSLLVFFGLGSFEVGLTLLGQQNLGLDPSRIGIMFMECSLVMLVAQTLLFSPLAGDRGRRRMIAPAFLLMAAGLGLLPFTAMFGVLLFLVGLVSAGSGILIPLLSYLVSLHGGASQGAALGKQTAAASLGQALGSATAGWLFGVTAGAPFWLTAGLLLIGVAIGSGIGRRLPEQGAAGGIDGSGSG